MATCDVYFWRPANNDVRWEVPRGGKPRVLGDKAALLAWARAEDAARGGTADVRAGAGLSREQERTVTRASVVMGQLSRGLPGMLRALLPELSGVLASLEEQIALLGRAEGMPGPQRQGFAAAVVGQLDATLSRLGPARRTFGAEAVQMLTQVAALAGAAASPAGTEPGGRPGPDADAARGQEAQSSGAAGSGAGGRGDPAVGDSGPGRGVPPDSLPLAVATFQEPFGQSAYQAALTALHFAAAAGLMGARVAAGSPGAAAPPERRGAAGAPGAPREGAAETSAGRPAPPGGRRCPGHLEAFEAGPAAPGGGAAAGSTALFQAGTAVAGDPSLATSASTPVHDSAGSRPEAPAPQAAGKGARGEEIPGV